LKIDIQTINAPWQICWGVQRHFQVIDTGAGRVQVNALHIKPFEK
jgi:hypothetical protein